MSEKKVRVKNKYLRFLLVVFMSLCCGLINATSFTPFLRAEASSEKPNIIYIFSDEQLFAGWNGQNSDVYTPNLNRLAADGMFFTQAVSNCPICVPYRNILVNGRMVRDDSVISNVANPDYTVQYDGYAKHLQNAGYYTGYVGKVHLTSGLATVAQRQSFGYDYWQQTLGEDCLDVSYYDYNSGTTKVYSGYAPTGQMTDAVNFVNDHADDSQPFLLTVSMFPPHAVNRDDVYVNADAPQKWVDYYADKTVTFRDGVSAAMRTPEAIASIKQYYAHCSAIDEEVGRMLDTVEAAGIKENTIIVFTSDHGDYLWTHNRQVGKGLPYEESVRVPFIVSWPAKISEGTTSDALFSAVDIAPTMLGLAGVSKPAYMDGTSFAPLLLGQSMTTPDAVFLSAEESVGFVPWRGVRTERYTYSVGKYNFLFDNQTDPAQLVNLFDNPAYAEVQAQLDARLYAFETQYGFPEHMAGQWTNVSNLMGNEGSFESGAADLEGWNPRIAGACNSSVTTADAYDGSQSLAVTNRLLTYDSPSYNVLPLIKELGLGTYKFVVNVKKMPGNTNGLPRMIFRHDGASPTLISNMGNVSGTTAEASMDANGWCQYILTVNMTQALYDEISPRGKVSLCFDSVIGDIYIDNLRIYKSMVTDYFSDGLVSNGSFESFSDGQILTSGVTTQEWYPNLAGVQIVSSPTKDGQRAAFVSDRTQAYHTVQSYTLKSIILANGTGTYRATAYIKVPAGQPTHSFRLTLKDTATGGVAVNSTAINVAPTDGWVKFSVEVTFNTMPTGAVGCYFNNVPGSATAPFASFYMDAFSFVKVPAADTGDYGLIQNGGFENLTENWTAINSATIVTTTDYVHTGTYALAVSNRISQWAVPQQDIKDALQNAGPGIYEFSFYARLAADETRTAQLKPVIDINSTGGTRRINPQGALTDLSSSEWTLVTMQATLDWTSVGMDDAAVRFTNWVNGTGGTFTEAQPVVYADDFKLEKIAALPTPVPTASPTPSPVPTATPTAAPTATPTAAPTATPSVAPTAAPTAAPTEASTAAPTAVPTEASAVTPTAVPTNTPAASGVNGGSTAGAGNNGQASDVTEGTADTGTMLYLLSAGLGATGFAVIFRKRRKYMI